MAISDWVDAIDAEIPGAAALLDVATTELPFPADIEHDGVAALGAGPVTPYREGIRATVELYRLLAAEGRLLPADHGITVTTPA